MPHSKKAVLITGASRRLGKEIALLLAKNNYDIALHYSSSEADAKAAQKEIKALGGNCELFQAELSNSQSCKMLLDQVLTIFPHLSVLVNNASIFEDSAFEETNEDLLERYLNIHLKVPFFLTQYFAHKVKSGNVVNMLDTMVTKNSGRFFTYLLTKKMLAEFTTMAARTLAPNIRVNAIAPGSILAALDFGDAYLEAKRQKLPLQYTPTTDQIAQAVQMILTNEFLIGQTIFVDSGERLI